MTTGLLLTAFGLGLRHGVDWDHIAAISDLASSTENRRRGFFLSFLYAIGHAAVVLVLGTAAIVAGAAIPESVDTWMGRVVGITLVWLGIWVLIQLVRRGTEFRLQSRWMIVLGGTFAGFRRVRSAGNSREISVEHLHDHDHGDVIQLPGDHDTRQAHDHAHIGSLENNQPVATPIPAVASGPSPSARGPLGHRHTHLHEHSLSLPTSAGYGSGSAVGIGMLHGVGVESPTQIAIFVASTSVVGTLGGVGLLVAWVVGLVVANSLLALAAGFGLLQAERNFRIYAALAVIVAIGSIAMGTLYILG